VTTDIELVLRLVAAVTAGAVVGLDREMHSKPAGLRTVALVSLAAALFTLVATEFPGAPAGDPIRAVQGVVIGVGFLGAGVIVRGEQQGSIHGLTTAATIWAAAALGVAFGLGLWLLGAGGLALVVFVLVVLQRVEHWLTDAGAATTGVGRKT